MPNNLGNVIFTTEQCIKKCVRKIERLKIRLIKAKYNVVFNKTCITEKLFPIYTNIKTHDPTARNEKQTYKFRRSHY